MRARRFAHSRRRMLVRVLDAGLLVIASGVWTHGSTAQAKASKSEYMYQDHPQRGNSCSHCKFFRPGGGDASAGTCAIIDGEISSSGWCMAFAPRPDGVR